MFSVSFGGQECFFPFTGDAPAYSAKLKHFKRQRPGVYSRLCTSFAMNTARVAILFVIIGILVPLCIDGDDRENFLSYLTMATMTCFFLVLAALMYFFRSRNVVVDRKEKIVILGRGPWMLWSWEVPFTDLLGLFCRTGGTKGITVNFVYLCYRTSTSEHKRCLLEDMHLEHTEELFREFCRLMRALPNSAACTHP